jgi:hypothetical protein
VSKIGVQNWCPKLVKKVRKKVQKKVQKKVPKKVRKIIIKNYKLLEGREGGWIIVIPMPAALNCVEGRRQKSVLHTYTLNNAILKEIVVYFLI